MIFSPRYPDSFETVHACTSRISSCLLGPGFLGKQGQCDWWYAIWHKVCHISKSWLVLHNLWSMVASKKSIVSDYSDDVQIFIWDRIYDLSIVVLSVRNHWSITKLISIWNHQKTQRAWKTKKKTVNWVVFHSVCCSWSTTSRLVESGKRRRRQSSKTE